MTKNHPLGYCPTCLDNPAVREAHFLEEAAVPNTVRCPQCSATFTTGRAGTLAKTRRVSGARSGWKIRRSKLGPASLTQPKDRP